MTGLDAMKRAVEGWWNDSDVCFILAVGQPEYIKKLCQVIHRLNHEVFNLRTGQWEYEGL